MKQMGEGPSMGLGTPRCLKRSASHSVAHCFPSLPPAEGSGGQWAKLREGVPEKVGAHRGITSPAGTRRAISGCWPQASGDGRQMASCTQRWGSSRLKSENQVTELFTGPAQGSRDGNWVPGASRCPPSLPSPAKGLFGN